MIDEIRNREDAEAMFREIRRFKQQISNEECLEILREEVRGVLSVLGDRQAGK